MPTSQPREDESQTCGIDTGFHTDWIALRTAAQPDAAASATLEHLCGTYWFPLYAYVRRRGYNPEDAQDLTQEFYARVLGTPWLEEVHPSKGKFRAYLLACMNRFLANQRRREHTEKRGGGSVVLSLEALADENRCQVEPAREDSPDKAFERHWALALLAVARARLQKECELTGKAVLFQALAGKLTGEHGLGYAEIAGRLGMSEDAVKKAAQRLRERYQTLLREEIAQTVSGPEEVEAELRWLFAALQG